MPSRSPLADRPWLNAYADGVPAEIEPVTETLVDLLEQLQDKYPARTDDFYYKGLKACLNSMFATSFTTRHNSRNISI